MCAVTEYRTHAEKCRELAFINGPADKKILERMAETWEKLADLRKRDRESEPEVVRQPGQLISYLIARLGATDCGNIAEPPEL